MKFRILQAGIAAAVLAVHLGAAAEAPVIEVYKSATCGCCTAWIKHLEQSGFTVHAHNVASTADYRQKFGVPHELGSCHTATVQGYALEGHVPAADIKRLLAEKPKATGLAVPGMPVGSPGMEMPGHAADSYDVVLMQGNGRHKVWRHYGAQ